MGDHFVLLVDRLLTESTLEAAIEIMQATSSSGVDDDDDDLEVEKSCQDVEFEDISTPRKMVECRICQDEDVDLNMEAPCSCCGSLKYAHRRCVQKWCNEKGNTTCEICHQQFKPGYTAPPPLFHLGRIPINLRGNRDMSRRDMRGPRFVAVVSTDHNLSSPDYDDHSAFGTRHLICCRSIAILIMLLLLLRHMLPILLSGTGHISIPLLLLIFLRVAGIVLPIYVLVKSLTAIQLRRQQQPEIPSSDEETDEEAEHESALQLESHVINVE
ncbi:E3 ubiquitin-protein ligase MARCHF2 [Linum perenne]